MSEIKHLLKSKVAQNGAWLMVLQIFNTIVPLLTLPYVTRILSTSDYGYFSIALNWIGYLQVVVEYGFGLTGARKAAMRKDDAELSKIQSSLICARMVLGILSACILGVLCLLPSVNHTQRICMIIMFSIVVSIIFQQTWFFQGISEMKNITIISVVSRLVSVALIFLLVRSSEDLYLYCFLHISNYIIVSFLGIIVTHKKYKVRFCRVSFKEIWLEIKDGWYLFTSTAMGKIFGSIGVTILAFWVTTSEVGIYSAINKIPYVLILLFSAVSQALYPYVCKKFSESFGQGIGAVKQTAKLIMIPFTLLGIIIIIFNKPIVYLACGEEYATMSMLLIPFVVWMLLSILNNFLGVQTLVASGAQKEYSRCFFISTVFMFAMMCLLGYFFGSYGVAVASMISEIFLSVLLIVNIRKKMRINNNL